MRFAALLFLAWPVAAVKTRDEDALGLEADESSSTQDRPVMKVVKLLEDMKTQLETDLEDDKDVHEKMDCWCDTNEKEKTQAIDEGELKIQSLKSALEEAAGAIGEMKVKRREAYEELQADKKSLSDASALRLKEQKAFGKDQADTAAALTSCKSAVEILRKHNPSLVEVRTAATALENSRILDIGVVDNLKKAALKNFVRSAKTATSFLSIPGFQSYGSQSGQIFGILSQMADDFASHLKEINEAEEKAVSDYNDLKASKEGQIAEGEKQIVELDKRLGKTTEQAAEDEIALKQTEEQLEADKTFLRKLQEKCEEGDKEFDQRVKDRMTELEAVGKAIQVLNDEDSFKVFDKTLSLLQTSSAATEKEQMRRQSAATKLQRAAAENDAPALAMIASRVQLDSFKEVKAAIEGEIASLEKQQKDEIKHKDWCVEEMHENTKDTQAADDKKDTLEVERDDLKKAIETMTNDIKAANELVAETKEQMKRASETREGANQDYQQTITDQRTTQMVLLKALNTMREVYALLQRARTHGRHLAAAGQEPPQGFKKYEKNAGGAKVIALLEGIIADSKTAEADAIAAEQNAQTTYEEFMTDSNKALNKKAEEIMTLSGNRAKAEEELNMNKKDLARTNKKLKNLAEEKDDLHGNCDFIMDNFEKRQDARGSEVDALKEAMAILSGAQ